MTLNLGEYISETGKVKFNILKNNGTLYVADLYKLKKKIKNGYKRLYPDVSRLFTEKEITEMLNDKEENEYSDEEIEAAIEFTPDEELENAVQLTPKEEEVALDFVDKLEEEEYDLVYEMFQMKGQQEKIINRLKRIEKLLKKLSNSA